MTDEQVIGILTKYEFPNLGNLDKKDGVLGISLPGFTFTPVPDYLNSLNVMRTIEEKILVDDNTSDELFDLYATCLIDDGLFNDKWHPRFAFKLGILVKAKERAYAASKVLVDVGIVELDKIQ